jgi:hypothetical protein
MRYVDKLAWRLKMGLCKFVDNTFIKPYKAYNMTQEQIQRQIEVIERVSAEVLKSKEASHQLLIDIGIIKGKKKVKSSNKKK